MYFTKYYLVNGNISWEICGLTCYNNTQILNLRHCLLCYVPSIRSVKVSLGLAFPSVENFHIFTVFTHPCSLQKIFHTGDPVYPIQKISPVILITAHIYCYIVDMSDGKVWFLFPDFFFT
jgi:hypothetical protein